MKFFSIFLIIFGLIIIAFPEFLAYLIGVFFLVVGINILIFNFQIDKMKKGKANKKSYIKFGDYEIYR